MLTRCATDTDEVVAIKHRQGDTLRLFVELSDSSGNPVDASGWSFDSDLKDATNADVATFEINDDDAALGVVEMTIDETIMALLPLADYSFAFVAVDLTPDTRTIFTAALRLVAV